MTARSAFLRFVLAGALIPLAWWLIDRATAAGESTIGNIVKLVTWPGAIVFLGDPENRDSTLFAVALAANVLFFAVLGLAYWFGRRKWGNGAWPAAVLFVAVEALLVAWILGLTA